MRIWGVNTMPRIIPIRDLKDTTTISQMCNESDEPVYITKNGYGDMVIMSMKVYEEKMFMADVYFKLARAEAEIRETLLAEKKATPVLQIRKHKDLSARIAELTEELEKLRSEKTRLLQSLDYAEDTSTDTIRKDISAMESMLENLSRQEQKYAAELDSTLKEYAGLEEQAAEVDPGELTTQRLAIRTEKEMDAVARVRSAYEDQYKPLVMSDAKRDVAKMLGEEEARPGRKMPLTKKRRQDEWER